MGGEQLIRCNGFAPGSLEGEETFPSRVSAKLLIKRRDRKEAIRIEIEC